MSATKSIRRFEVPTVHHLLIVEDCPTRKTLYLEDDTYTLGRHSSNSLVIPSQKVSRFHATLLKRKDPKTNETCYWILDGDLIGNKSNNGLFINHDRCLVHTLKNGDIIHFGPDIKAIYHIVNTEQNSHSASPKNEHKWDTLPGEVDNTIEQKNQEETLYNPLTNLASPTLLKEHLSKTLANIRREPGQLAILTLEISNLDTIIQTLGNSIVEPLLKSIAERLQTCFRLGDIISHWPQNQFIILLPRLNNPDHTIKLAQRLLQGLKVPFNIINQKIELKCYLGIAIYPQDGQDIDTLLRRSKVALCRAKQKEDKQYGFYNQQMNAKVAGILTLETLLKKAITQNELFLQYQPKVNIRTGQVDGLEALLRWQHPQFGLILPKKFIDLAGESQIIIILCQWILKTVCHQIQEWCKRDTFSLPVAVNLSSGEFYYPNLVKILTEVLNISGLEPSLLELDISEKTLLKNVVRSSKILQDLNRLGVRLCVDNFGLGESSLIHLKQWSVHSLKIDQSLVSQLINYPQDVGIISAAIAWGHSFNFRVVASGVETQAQLNILRNLACEEMQGYRFSKPLLAKEASTYLADHLSSQS